MLRSAQRSLGIGILTTFALLAGDSAWGQKVKYDQFKRPAGFDVAKQAAVGADLNAGAVPNAKDLQNFYVAKFAEMTNPAKDKDIHKTRLDIKKQLQTSGNAAAPAAHDAANAFLLQHLPRLIVGLKPNLHPTVRYNLALLLADLDSVERKGQSNPVPLAAARPELLKLLANTKAHDSARLAAVNGLSRHATLDNNAAARAEIANGVLAYLDELDKSPEATRKRNVKFWFESRAMEALGATETPTPEIVAALQARLVDANRPIWLRNRAAVSLGQLKYVAGAQVDLPALIAGYQSLLETAVDQEITRRELRDVIFSVKRGIAGLSDPAPNALVTLMDAAQKSESTQMVNAMSKMAEACESSKIASEARVVIAIKEIMNKWKAGEYSSELDADARANLSEDESSGEPAEGEEDLYEFGSGLE
ncbi:MAG: hypothetical protein SGJ19_00475 [Planctomycetia bacterium]|nr:hypothetical protein [Planctomycetia bacterium]